MVHVTRTIRNGTAPVQFRIPCHGCRKRTTMGTKKVHSTLPPLQNLGGLGASEAMLTMGQPREAARWSYARPSGYLRTK